MAQLWLETSSGSSQPLECSLRPAQKVHAVSFSSIFLHILSVLSDPNDLDLHSSWLSPIPSSLSFFTRVGPMCHLATVPSWLGIRSPASELC